LQYGKIIDVRLPSLKYNTHRRFCYVQFEDSDQAQHALNLGGKEIEGNALVVKISDPNHKQDRSGALYEGRELHVSNLDWSATRDELTEIFSKYGKVEKVRILRTVDGRSKGTAFVVFSSRVSTFATKHVVSH
jgi:RNA recognition motif-containing protein